MAFQVKKISKCEYSDIDAIGFDKSYSSKVIDKYQFLTLKIFNLTSPQASIIKQTALSVGTDCANHRDVLTCKIDKSDIVLSGSKRQLKLIANKLENQPFNLKELAKEIRAQIEIELENIIIRNQKFDWSKKTYIMGIINVTPDSFSDGGRLNSIDDILKAVDEMVKNNVDIIDIGGESTRPYAQKVEVEEEINRVIPVVKEVRKKYPKLVISVDTRNSKTAKAAMNSGADIINDISFASWDEDILEIVKETGAFYIINHSMGTPENMQDNPKYENVVDDVFKEIQECIEKVLQAGIKKEKLIIDVGIGFGKTFEHNIELIKKMDEFSSIGLPILAGVSRKSVISNVIGKEASIEEKDLATLALNSYLASKDINILRVHNVKMHKALEVIDALN